MLRMTVMPENMCTVLILHHVERFAIVLRLDRRWQSRPDGSLPWTFCTGSAHMRFHVPFMRSHAPCMLARIVPATAQWRPEATMFVFRVLGSMLQLQVCRIGPDAYYSPHQVYEKENKIQPLHWLASEQLRSTIVMSTTSASTVRYHNSAVATFSFEWQPASPNRIDTLSVHLSSVSITYVCRCQRVRIWD